jgi:diguanylate cyclase (GGDEF)-like protein
MASIPSRIWMSRSKPRVTVRSLICVAVGFIALALVAIGMTVWGLRSDAIKDAVREAGNIATVLAEQTARSVQSVDLVLTETQERIATFDTTAPADLYRLLQQEMAHDLLKERLERLPQADIVFVVDRDGRLLSSSRTWPTLNVDLSDRDYFRHFLLDPQARLYVSAPSANRVTGTATIFFSKPLKDFRGQFLGVIVIGLRTDYFRHIYDSITSLRDQSFLFLRDDGTVLARHPDVAGGGGQKIPALSPWYRLAAEGGGYYRSDSAFERQPQLVAVRPLRDYQLVVDVAFAEAAALATWRYRATLIGIGTLLAVLCAVFLLNALGRQFRRLLGSEARLAEKSGELERANARLDAALNNMSQGLLMFDGAERLIVCNERYLRMYGMSAGIVRPGCTLRQLLEYRKAIGCFSEDIDVYIGDLRARLAQGDSIYLTKHLSDGRVIAILNQPVAGGGWVATHEDMTDRQRVEARIAHMACHDALTDLANRVLFQQEMDEAIERLRRRGEGFSLFVFDLDQFKAVNDSFGHPVGDALLKAVAQRLRELAPNGGTMARLGGDEFAILHSVKLDQQDGAIRLAKKLLKAVCAPYDIDGHRIVIGISVGIALAPEHGRDANQLLKNADLALYRAKSDGRNDYRFFETDMDVAARMRHALELDLRDAIGRNEFELHYQTIVNAATEETCGVEALVRWRHRQLGLIAPEKFVPLAEEIGLIIPLGQWIIRQACLDAVSWPEPVKLAVNLSPVQFRNGDVVDVVKAALSESGLAPGRLELEVTESVLLQKNAANISTLHQLKQLGACIVLDDFGAGYSSLSYLRIFPFDKIKIDRSFVAELSIGNDCVAIVCAITNLGKALNVETTAEGVETQDQFELLRMAGCSRMQGFRFSRPCPAAELDVRPRTSLGNAGRAA